MPTTGLVAASFTHGVNRNLDPHLHTHVVMANMVHGHDGRWSACDHRGLSAHRGATSAIYEAHLRAALTTRLGVQWVDAPGSVRKWRGSPSSPAVSSRRDPPTSVATCPRGIAFGPGRADRMGGDPVRKAMQGSTSPS